MFARDGFHGASIDEVAATAGFTKGAVYSNFKNKDDLFLELLDDRLARQFALVETILEDAPNIDRDDEMNRMADFVWRDEQRRVDAALPRVSRLRRPQP